MLLRQIGESEAALGHSAAAIAAFQQMIEAAERVGDHAAKADVSLSVCLCVPQYMFLIITYLRQGLGLLGIELESAGQHVDAVRCHTDEIREREHVLQQQQQVTAASEVTDRSMLCLCLSSA